MLIDVAVDGERSVLDMICVEEIRMDLVSGTRCDKDAECARKFVNLIAKDRESNSIASFVQGINHYHYRPTNRVLTNRLQNELIKLMRLACRSYTAVIFEDLADASNKIIAQTNKIACNSTEEPQGAPSVRDISIEEEG